MHKLKDIGIINPKNVYMNLSAARLVEEALKRGEGSLSATGAINVRTGKYTGRSPNDKFLVDEPSVHDDIWWENNKAMSRENFDRLFARLIAYLQNRDLFVFDGFAGADPNFRLPLRVINEYAYQNLFVKQLFIEPTPEELETHSPGFTVIAALALKQSPKSTELTPKLLLSSASRKS